MRVVVCSLLLAALLGCKGEQPTEIESMGAPPVPEGPSLLPNTVPFTVTRLETIDWYLGSSGLNESARMVIRRQDEWTALYSRMLNAHGPKPAMPVVDFSQHMLIVAAMGSRPTGGYRIRIESVSRQNSVITAHVRLTSPGMSCFTSQAFTEPADIVRISRSELPVVFRDEHIVREC